MNTMARLFYNREYQAMWKIQQVRDSVSTIETGDFDENHDKRDRLFESVRDSMP